MSAAMQERMKALRLTIPVMCGYLFLGVAFGATLAQAGFGAAWALMISGLVNAGSLQFVMVPFLVSGASLVTVFLTALMVNARHIFYGVSFIDRFARMGKARPYMVFSLTDETYSLRLLRNHPFLPTFLLHLGTDTDMFPEKNHRDL